MVSTPASATSDSKIFFSLLMVWPVRSLTSTRKAWSVGAKTVARFVPSATMATGESGFAATTARAASVRMSKSLAFLSNSSPSEVRRPARLSSPTAFALAAGAAAVMAPRARAEVARSAGTRRIRGSFRQGRRSAPVTPFSERPGRPDARGA